MINSADEFVRLRVSDEREDYVRAVEEEATIDVWLDVIARYPEMRQWVVLNKTIPLDILRQLALDPDREVRAAVADKRKLDLQLFDVLANDAEEIVRQRIAYNKKTPLEVLQRLAQDESPLVRDVVLKRLG